MLWLIFLACTPKAVFPEGGAPAEETSDAVELSPAERAARLLPLGSVKASEDRLTFTSTSLEQLSEALFLLEDQGSLWVIEVLAERRPDGKLRATARLEPRVEQEHQALAALVFLADELPAAVEVQIEELWLGPKDYEIAVTSAAPEHAKLALAATKALGPMSFFSTPQGFRAGGTHGHGPLMAPQPELHLRPTRPHRAPWRRTRARCPAPGGAWSEIDAYIRQDHVVGVVSSDVPLSRLRAGERPSSYEALRERMADHGLLVEQISDVLVLRPAGHQDRARALPAPAPILASKDGVEVRLEFVCAPPKDAADYMSRITETPFIVTDPTLGDLSIASGRSASLTEATQIVLLAFEIEGYTRTDAHGAVFLQGPTSR